MGRAMALRAARPDLHDRIIAGEITLNEALRLRRRDQTQSRLAALPKGKYRVIYADPPWSYGDKREEIGEGLAYGPATGHYPAMTLQNICSLDVASIAQDDTVLFLWATSPMLFDAGEWLFRYYSDPC
jgi:hypothetical protein